MPQPTATHHRWDEIAPEPMTPLLTRQFVTGAQSMLARIDLKKGAHVPLHSHPNEQIAYVLSGLMKFVLKSQEGGHEETREVLVREGEILVIPANLPHEAFALEDTIDLDIFAPPRHDWLTGDDAYLRG